MSNKKLPKIEVNLDDLSGLYAVPGKYKQPDGSWITYGQKIAKYANIINSEVEPTEPIVSPILQKGSKGEEVKELQRYLNAVGASLVADGIFGPITESKVKAYQKDNNLDITGYIIDEDKDKMNNFEIINQPKIRLKIGDKNEQVKKLQKYLASIGYYLIADGIFGPITESKVKAYQEDNNLDTTGYVTEDLKDKMNKFKVNKKEEKKFDVIVQMGHVGRTSGATGAYREMEWTEKLGNAMAKLLKLTKLKYHVMGADDWLKPEPNKCRIFFSMHYDGNKNTSARGYSMGFKPDSDPAFKEAMAQSYGKLAIPNISHRRPDNYTAGLRNYYAWTLKGKRKYHHVIADWYALLEHGFGSNKIERDWMFDNIDRIAKHHVDLIVEFLNKNG